MGASPTLLANSYFQSPNASDFLSFYHLDTPGTYVQATAPLTEPADALFGASVTYMSRPAPPIVESQYQLPPNSKDGPNLQLAAGRMLADITSNSSLYTRLVQLYFRDSKAHVTPEPIVASFLASMQDSLRAQSPRLSLGDTSAFEGLATLISQNTARDVIISPETTMGQFTGFFIGHSLRWETIGLICTLAASSCMLLSSDDSIFHGHSVSSVSQLTANLLRYSTFCVERCRDSDQANDASLWLRYHNLIAITQCHGDSCKSSLQPSDFVVLTDFVGSLSWRLMGELSTDVYALGLHQAELLSNIPVFIRESRRLTFAAAYSVDKSLCAFFKRPPRIPRLYGTPSLPLDLPHNVVFTEDASKLSDALGHLDQDGWSIVADIPSPASWIRLRFRLNSFLEEVLGLAYGDVHMDLEKAKLLWVISRILPTRY